MEKFSQLVTWVDGKVWGWGMILLLLGNHLFMTVRTGFIQRKTITKGIKLSVSKEPDADGEVSQFGALATALASTIGTGNIIGVGTAVALGGPGAVLWCWLTGVFGIATKYSESLIAVKYRVKTEDGRMQGGAMYALERGLHMRWLGLIFAVFAGFASFGIGCATQVNAIATVCNENLHINKAVVGIIIGVLTAVVIFGGIKSIARVCERLVPFMVSECGRHGVTRVFFMLTNIIEESTELLYYGEGSEEMARIAFHMEPKDGVFDLKGVVSRKKQLIPALMEAAQAGQNDYS